MYSLDLKVLAGIKGMAGIEWWAKIKCLGWNSMYRLDIIKGQAGIKCINWN
jgi:hypothetical protein